MANRVQNDGLQHNTGRLRPPVQCPRGRALFTPQDLYISQLTGIYEALAAGVTTILDHAHHTWSIDHAAAGLNASVDSGARIFFAYAFQNVSAEFGIPEQIAQWKELSSAISSNLTELAIAYDDFTGNPIEADTLAIIDLIKSVYPVYPKYLITLLGSSTYAI